jgi:DNA-binding transcriptional ArsR family regulator
MNVKQLADASGRSLSVVGHHLRWLRAFGVVALSRNGNRRLYRLTSEEARYLLGLVCQGGA